MFAFRHIRQERPAEPITIFSTAEGTSEWREFVAALCGFQFLVDFVHLGADAADYWSFRSFVFDARVAVWGGSEAALLVLLGVAIQRRWRAMPVLALLWLIALVGWYRSEAEQWVGTGYSRRTFPLMLPPADLWYGTWLVAMHDADRPRLYATLAALVLGRIACWRGKPLSWAVIAAAWCIGLIPPVDLLGAPVFLWECCIARTGGFGSLVDFAAPITYVPLLLTAVALLFGSGTARLAALTSAAAQTACRVIEVLGWRYATIATWSIGYTGGVAHSLLTRDVAQIVLVDWVWSAGPLLFIAWFVRHRRLRSIPEDGSPYPRRYCPRCLFNLQGASGAICSECGQALRKQTTAGNRRAVSGK